MDYTKPWMRPCIYDPPKPEPEVELESDPKPEAGLVNRPEREREDLSAVKPRGGMSLDTSPMVYRRPRYGAVIDLEDEDEIVPAPGDSVTDHEESF